jgi:hypothetical protein
MFDKNDSTALSFAQRKMYRKGWGAMVQIARGRFLALRRVPVVL